MAMAPDNTARYKAGFTTASTKKDFIKHTPFKFVPGLSPEKLASLGMKRETHPTPVDYGADGRGK